MTSNLTAGLLLNFHENHYLYLEEDDADKSEFFRLKRRFKRDQEKSKIFFAKQNVRKQQMRDVSNFLILSDTFYF